MSTYYYSEDGNRIGPKTDDEMRKLITDQNLSRTTLCWTADFGSNWKSIGETSLWSATYTNSVLPPLPPQAVNNFYAYVIAAIPLLGAVVEAVVSESTPETVGTLPIIALYVVAYTIITGLDLRVIRRSGNKTSLPTLWFWLVPVYLWLRAKRLGQRKTYLLAWVVCLILGIAIDQPEVKGAIYLGSSDLPYCKSAFATNQVSRIFPDIPLNKITGIKSVMVKDIEDQGITSGKRTCRASVLTSAGTSVKVHYRMEAHDNSIYTYVELEQ